MGGDFWYLGMREVQMDLLARGTVLWRLPPPGIARRSSVLRWSCGFEEEHEDLGTQNTRKCVTGMHHGAVNMLVRKERGEASWVHR